MFHRSMIAAAAVLAFAAAPAIATTTYAQFRQIDTAQKTVNVATSGSVTTLSIAPTQVEFTVFDFGPVGSQTLMLTGSATSMGDPVQSGLLMSQGPYAGSFSFMDGDTNWLTISFTQAGLAGVAQGTAGGFVGATPWANMTVTSDVLDVSNFVQSDFSFAFSGIQPRFDIAEGYSFDANLAGTFAAAIPEPATWAMLIAGFGMVGITMRRRNRGIARTMA